MTLVISSTISEVCEDILISFQYRALHNFANYKNAVGYQASHQGYYSLE